MPIIDAMICNDGLQHLLLSHTGQNKFLYVIPEE